MHTFLRSLTLFATLLVALLVSVPCAAQDDTAMAPEVRAEGRRMFAEADAHVAAERWAMAADAYQRLYDFMTQHRLPRAPVAHWNRGLALMRIAGREREARDSLQRFLDDSNHLTEDADVRDWRSAAVGHLAELDARLGGAAAAQGGVPTSSDGSSRMSPVGPILLAGGVLIAAVGGVLGAVALVNENGLRGRCDGTTRCLDTPEHRGAYDEIRALGVATDVLLVVGGLTAVAGVILTFTITEGGASETQARVRVGPGGMALEGSF